MTKAKTHLGNYKAETHRHLHQGRHHVLPPPLAVGVAPSESLRRSRSVGGPLSEAHPTVGDLTKAWTHLGNYKGETHRVNPEADTHHHLHQGTSTQLSSAKDSPSPRPPLTGRPTYT